MFRYLIFVFFTSTFVEGQRWHTSQTSLMQLYQLQEEHLNLTKEYVELEKTRLGDLKNVLEVHNQLLVPTLGMTDYYILCPMNGYKLIKRINDKMNEIKYHTSNEKSLKVLEKVTATITDIDTNFGVQAIRRLQRFYEIPAVHMAAGRYMNRIIGDPLNSCYCYVICKYCSEENDVYGTLDWAIQTYDKWTKDGKPKCVDINKLYNIITISSIEIGFDYTTLINSEKDKSHYLENLNHIIKHFSLMKNELYIITTPIPHLEIFDTYNELSIFEEDYKFKQICKIGESTRTITFDSKCRYQTKNSPYRLLMPFKEEDIDSNPYIKMYHDVLFDSEIKTLKMIAGKNIKDAEVKSADGGSILTENTRSGQVGWVGDNDVNGELDALNSRVESMTEFSIKTAEKYQVVNYGLGGHYVCHFDPFSKKLLNDVVNDGFTIFPRANVIASCIKGSAIVWHNLHMSNGTIHQNSLHGSCPILKGNKSILTKWLYESGQNLTYNWENITEYKMTNV